MDKLIEALVGILANLGLDEASINGVVEQLSAIANEEVAVEENPVEGNPAEEQVEADVPPVSPEEVPNEDGSEVPPSADLPTDEVQASTEEVPVPPESEVPPVAPAAPFDPTEILGKIDEVANENVELKKANEGLLARVQALEEALKNAGVIDSGSATATQVGDALPSAAPQSPTDDVFGSVLAELNGHKRF